MGLKIVCSGHLVRYPLGGHSWHQIQYLVGLQQLGHEVTFFEDYGWPDSCYDPSRDEMTADPSYGIAYLKQLLTPWGLDESWCYLAEDGTAYGMPRERLAQMCAESDLYLNIDNINWIPEVELCRRRSLIDVDPVFTQIGAHGSGGSFESYDVLFTYGENVHKPGCDMPTGGARWHPTRQPVVLDLWQAGAGDPGAPFTTVINWSAYGDAEYEGRVFGQKDRQFEPFFSLPGVTGQTMEIAISGPSDVQERLAGGGWRLANPLQVAHDPWSYQEYLQSSRAEFCVSKHGYVVTHSGWFSDRSAGYLASGRPVVLQDTGFSDWLPCGEGLVAYRTAEEAVAAIRVVGEEYPAHCRAARALAEEYLDSRRVLTDLLERAV